MLNGSPNNPVPVDESPTGTMAAVTNGDHTQSDTIKTMEVLLSSDTKVKVAGIDFDGVLRGKIMSKEKFISSIKGGFGMSSAVFGWDMHDVLFETETSITGATTRFADLVAVIDLHTMRRFPFEDNIPCFLLRFIKDNKPVCADGRGIIAALTEELANSGYAGLAGVELEFMNFQTPSEDGYDKQDARKNIASFLKGNTPDSLRPLTSGMFGYSISRPIMSKSYFYDLYDQSRQVGCPIESWHTESGPGVFEAALAVSPVSKMADNVAIFKLLAKSIGVDHGVTPCFMAKPTEGLPGNSGHIHISLCDHDGNNIFARTHADQKCAWPDIAYLSDVGQSFLAGLLEALPDIMPLLVPNVNSYKRLVENYWAPVTLSWGLEDRLSSIRLVAQPICKPSATRFEVRVPGADLHPHYALAAIFKAGWRGIRLHKKLTTPPSTSQPAGKSLPHLPNSLEEALKRFESADSLAREVMGSEFVDAFSISRHHELRVWRQAVTDWEIRRYIETA